MSGIRVKAILVPEKDFILLDLSTIVSIMFVSKNNYYLYIENTKTLNLSLIKKRNKFIIIYRNNNNHENIDQLKIKKLK